MDWNATKLELGGVRSNSELMQFKLGQMRFILSGTSLAKVNKYEIIFNLPKLFQVLSNCLRIVVKMILFCGLKLILFKDAASMVSSFRFLDSDVIDANFVHLWLEERVGYI